MMRQWKDTALLLIYCVYLRILHAKHSLAIKTNCYYVVHFIVVSIEAKQFRDHVLF